MKPCSAAPLLIALLTLLPACKRATPAPAGPPSTRTTSSAFKTLGEKVAFLDQYVTFRRTYETLDFDVFFANHGGGSVPGPSEWDVRIVATVPASELAAWLPPGVARCRPVSHRSTHRSTRRGCRRCRPPSRPVGSPNGTRTAAARSASIARGGSWRTGVGPIERVKDAARPN